MIQKLVVDFSRAGTERRYVGFVCGSSFVWKTPRFPETYAGVGDCPSAEFSCGCFCSDHGDCCGCCCEFEIPRWCRAVVIHQATFFLDEAFSRTHAKQANYIRGEDYRATPWKMSCPIGALRAASTLYLPRKLTTNIIAHGHRVLDLALADSQRIFFVFDPMHSWPN